MIRISVNRKVTGIVRAARHGIKVLGLVIARMDIQEIQPLLAARDVRSAKRSATKTVSIEESMRLDRLTRLASTDMEKELCHLVMFLLPNIDWQKEHAKLATEATQIAEIQIRTHILQSLGMERYNYQTSGMDDLEKRGR